MGVRGCEGIISNLKSEIWDVRSEIRFRSFL